MEDFFFQTLLSLKLLLRKLTKKIRFYHISNDFCNIPGGGPKTRKNVQFLNFGRLPPGQVFIGFQKNFGFGLLNLYLQHILGASKSGKLDDPLGGRALMAWPLLEELFLRHSLANENKL